MVLRSRSSPRSRKARASQARVVSSTAIRRALEQGDVKTAARGLGRHYSVSGRVVSGQRLGRTLGVPTANIALEPTSRLAHGVYAVRVRIDGEVYPGCRQFRRPPDRRQRSAAARGPSPRLWRRSLWARHRGRIRRAHSGGAQVRFARAAHGGMERDKERARAILAKYLKAPCDSPQPIWRFAPNPLMPSRLRPSRTRCGAATPMTDAPDTGLDYSQTLFPAEDRFSDAGRPAAEGAGDSRPLGARGPLRRTAGERQGPAKIRSARRPALRQRQCSHRHCAQQDPEGHGRPLASDGGQGFELRPRLGLPRPADRVEGRGGILSQQGQGEARLLRSGGDHRLPPGMPRLCRALDLRAAARNSSGSAWSATGTIPIRP